MISHFENTFRRFTKRAPNGRAGRIYLGAVIIRIRSIKEHHARLARIETIPLFRYKGFGSQALELLCDIANDTHTTLYLCPAPDYPVVGLDLDQLTQWYLRHGFKDSAEGEMIRYPLCTQTASSMHS